MNAWKVERIRNHILYASEITENSTVKFLRISDPRTHEGYETGAILKIQRQTYGTWDKFAVGDHVQILFNNRGLTSVLVEDPKTDVQTWTEWEAFYPASKTDRCFCVQANRTRREYEHVCCCVYAEPRDIPRPKFITWKTPQQPPLNDPAQPDGQIIGAALKIKQPHTVSGGIWSIEVNDCVGSSCTSF